MVLEDISERPEIYNLFEIQEGVDINLKTPGDYQMKIYQMPNDTSTNIADGTLIMIDKMRLLKQNETTKHEFIQANTESIY